MCEQGICCEQIKIESISNVSKLLDQQIITLENKNQATKNISLFKKTLAVCGLACLMASIFLIGSLTSNIILFLIAGAASALVIGLVNFGIFLIGYIFIGIDNLDNSAIVAEFMDNEIAINKFLSQGAQITETDHSNLEKKYRKLRGLSQKLYADFNDLEKAHVCNRDWIANLASNKAVLQAVS